MIGKVAPIRTGRPSSFGALARYITTGRPGIERVAAVRVTNCESPDPRWAALEVQATQQLNKRCGPDRTYHLLLSFPPGERPSAEVLAAVEDRMVEALGYGEHQRISAVHTDTDHLHIHIAINKIHPKRLTQHTPHRDFQTIGAVCAQLEVEFGLQATNHARQQSTAASRGADMETIGARESLQGFLRRECGDALRAATTWSEVHAILQAHGVRLAPRGAGLAFSDGQGRGVRASTVHRALSLKAMEDRLGAFQPSMPTSPLTGPLGRRRYTKGPIGRESWREELFNEYQGERQARLDARTPRYVSMRNATRAKIDQAKAKAARKRALVKHFGGGEFGGGALTRRLLYAQISRELRSDIERIHRRARAERQVIREHTRRLSWPDWLRAQAKAGNERALWALRTRRGSGHAVTAESLGGVATEAMPAPLPGRVAHVTSSGTVWRDLAGARVLEDGQRVYVRGALDDRAAKAALILAVRQYGHTLDVEGSDDFRARVARIARSVDGRIRFTTMDMERLRMESVPRRQDGQASADRTRTGRGIEAAAGRRVDGGRGADDESNAQRRTSAQPRTGTTAAGAATGAIHGLRRLSEGNLVRVRQLGDVLLPAHVHGDVEHQRAANTAGLRRAAEAPRGVDRRPGRRMV